MFFLAAVLLLIGGFGAAALLLRGRDTVSLGELVALAVLLGALGVTLTAWAMSFFGSGRASLVVARALCVSLGVSGVRIWLRQRPRLTDVGPFCLLALPLAAGVAWLTATSPFEWDGLFIWQVKAQAIAAEGGLPLHYLHDDSRAWSHPVYPLLLPYYRFWFEGSLGSPHEAYAKLSGTLFFLAAAGLLTSLASRLSKGVALAALALLALTPLEILGAGSATSGYADFPLAVYYLGALLYLFHALEEKEPAGDLAIAGWLAAALPWIKQEGTVLFLVSVLGLGLLALGRAGWRQLPRLAGPGLAVLIAWWAFVRAEKVETAQVFLHPTLALLRERLHLWDDVAAVMARLAFSPGPWGLLWILFPLAILLGLVPRHGRRRTLFLAGAVAVPLGIFSFPYLFSLWNPVTLHVENSFSRILLQLSLPAIVLIAWRTAALFRRLPS